MREEYDAFMEEYVINHQYCPECGSENYCTTYVGYTLNIERKEEYKDLTSCTCTDCGSKHTTHERIKEKPNK